MNTKINLCQMIVLKKKISQIVKKYGNNSVFDTGKENETLTFPSGDLQLALHNVYIQVIGSRNDNSNWDLEVIMTDVYDFTDLQELQKYIKVNGTVNENVSAVVGATGNNLAIVATSCNVIHKYNVTIKFSIKDWSG